MTGEALEHRRRGRVRDDPDHRHARDVQPGERRRQAVVLHQRQRTGVHPRRTARHHQQAGNPALLGNLEGRERLFSRHRAENRADQRVIQRDHDRLATAEARRPGDNRVRQHVAADDIRLTGIAEPDRIDRQQRRVHLDEAAIVRQQGDPLPWSHRKMPGAASTDAMRCIERVAQQVGATSGT